MNMSTFALIHGAGSTAWDWHLVSPLLEAVGHTVIAVDLPSERADAQLADYVDTVEAATAGHDSIIVVGHSLGGFTAPLAAERLGAIGLAYVTAMIPNPGESFEQWWANTRYSEVPEHPEPYFNGVPEELAREAEARERDQQGAWMADSWPGAHPPIPTLAIAGRDDRFFPLDFMRRQVRERLGIDTTEVDGGHYLALANPHGLAAALDAFARGIRLAT
jgi:pimeloyl-ACP methyl ester carboxylesterase